MPEGFERVDGRDRSRLKLKSQRSAPHGGTGRVAITRKQSHDLHGAFPVPAAGRRHPSAAGNAFIHSRQFSKTWKLPEMDILHRFVFTVKLW